MRTDLTPLLCLALLATPGCPSDGDDDDVAGSSCADLLSAGDSWSVDPDGEDGQIHPQTVLADGVLWSAWNRPDGGSNFAVFAAARSCDGALIAGPVRLDAGEGNSTDPAIAVSGDRVLVAWQTDDGGVPFNLSVRTAVLSTDGSVIADEARAEFLDGGAPVPGQSWMARVAPDPVGFLLVAVRAGDQESWHVVAQRLDGDGASVGDMVPITSPSDEAFEPAVAVDGDGAVIAWQDSFDGSEGFGAARLSGDNAVPVLWPMLASPGLGVALSGGEGLWGVVGTAGGARAGEMLEPGQPLGTTAAQSPGIAARADGAVAAWAEGSAANATWWLRWIDGAESGDPIEVGAGAAYSADLVALDDTHVLLTRAVGSSPAFRIEAEVVEVP